VIGILLLFECSDYHVGTFPVSDQGTQNKNKKLGPALKDIRANYFLKGRISKILLKNKNKNKSTKTVLSNKRSKMTREW